MTAIDVNSAAGSLDPDVVLPTTDDLAALADQVWQSFIGEPITVVGAASGDAPRTVNSADQAVGTVSIRGPWSGHLTFGVTPDAAAEIAAAMFAMELDEVSPAEIADALGELANIVGGNVKGMLPEPSTLSLPQVIIDARSLTLPGARHYATADFEWRGHPISLTLWDANGKDSRS